MIPFILQLNKHFTHAEKESCIPAIRRVIELATIVRLRGILALEVEMHEENSTFLKTGLELVLDGVDPELVEQTLQLLILSEDYSGSPLLERLLMSLGVLNIQGGVNPRIVISQLLALLGEEYLKRVDEFTLDDKNNSYVEIFDLLQGKESSPESILFENKIRQYSRRDIQFILRRIEYQMLAYALYGCSDKMINIILDNLSYNNCTDVCEMLMQFNNDSQNPESQLEIQKYSSQVQNDILKIVEQLEKRGDIIPSKIHEP